MTNHNTLRKAAILITALDARSADQLLDQMPEAYASRVRQAVFDLDDIDPQEQQQILSEFLRSTGREPEAPPPAAPPASEHVSSDEGVELQLSSSAHEPQAEPLRPYTPATVAAEVDTFHNPYPEQAPPAESRPFDFLHDQSGEQLARTLQREHPQTIAVVVAHLPAERAADMVGELPSALQAEVLRRVADLVEADPEALLEIEQELRRSFQSMSDGGSSASAGMTTVSSILAAAGHSRDAMIRNIRQHDRQLSRRIGEQPDTERPVYSSHINRNWHDPRADQARSKKGSHDLDTEIAEYRSLARSAQEFGNWSNPEEEKLESVEDSHQEPVSSSPVLEWSFSDLDALSDSDLARVLQSAESELTLVALTGAEPAFVARLANQLPPAMARQFSHRIETVGPLKLRDIEAAQQQIATIAAQLAEEGVIQQKPNKPFAMAA